MFEKQKIKREEHIDEKEFCTRVYNAYVEHLHARVHYLPCKKFCVFSVWRLKIFGFPNTVRYFAEELHTKASRLFCFKKFIGGKVSMKNYFETLVRANFRFGRMCS